MLQWENAMWKTISMKSLISNHLNILRTVLWYCNRYIPQNDLYLYCQMLSHSKQGINTPTDLWNCSLPTLTPQQFWGIVREIMSWLEPKTYNCSTLPWCENKQKITLNWTPQFLLLTWQQQSSNLQGVGSHKTFCLSFLMQEVHETKFIPGKANLLKIIKYFVAER